MPKPQKKRHQKSIPCRSVDDPQYQCIFGKCDFAHTVTEHCPRVCVSVECTDMGCAKIHPDRENPDEMRKRLGWFQEKKPQEDSVKEFCDRNGWFASSVPLDNAPRIEVDSKIKADLPLEKAERPARLFRPPLKTTIQTLHYQLYHELWHRMENEIEARFCAPPPVYVMTSMSSHDPDLLEEFADILKEFEICNAIEEEDCLHFLNDEAGHDAEDDEVIERYFGDGGLLDQWVFVEELVIASQ